MQCYILKMGGNFEPSGTTTSPEYNNFFSCISQAENSAVFVDASFLVPIAFPCSLKEWASRAPLLFIEDVVLSDPSLPYVTFRRET